MRAIPLILKALNSSRAVIHPNTGPRIWIPAANEWLWLAVALRPLRWFRHWLQPLRMSPVAAHSTYVMSLPEQDPIANLLRKLLPGPLACTDSPQNIALARGIWRFCQRFPMRPGASSAGRIVAVCRRYPVDEHFNPPYNPWDQRLCAVPDGDLFKAISSGKASIVTDHIRTFTERGIQLVSGKTLNADIIVTATGLNLQLFGGATLEIDGKPFELSKHVAFKGMMLNDLPNFAFAIGYTNSSWTLKVGLLWALLSPSGAYGSNPDSHLLPQAAVTGYAYPPDSRFWRWIRATGYALLPRQVWGHPGRCPWTTTTMSDPSVKAGWRWLSAFLFTSKPLEQPRFTSTPLGVAQWMPVVFLPLMQDQLCLLPNGIQLCYRQYGEAQNPRSRWSPDWVFSWPSGLVCWLTGW